MVRWDVAFVSSGFLRKMKLRKTLKTSSSKFCAWRHFHFLLQIFAIKTLIKGVLGGADTGMTPLIRSSYYLRLHLFFTRKTFFQFLDFKLKFLAAKIEICKNQQQQCLCSLSLYIFYQYKHIKRAQQTHLHENL